MRRQSALPVCSRGRGFLVAYLPPERACTSASTASAASPVMIFAILYSRETE